MRALAVLSPSLDKKIDIQDKHYLKIDSTEVPLAMIHVADTEFLPENDLFADAVLVRKKGFSLNYRDFGIIERAWKNLKDLNQDSYYPIGSDFCGYVEQVGKNVKSLKKGDLVIADCFYPEAKEGIRGGIPTNHGSKELEVIPSVKLKKLPNDFSIEQAAAMSIGTQTSVNMINRANIVPKSKVLVTSVTSNTSLFLLNFLRGVDCEVYGLSYSGQNIDKVKKEFPFIKEIFSIKKEKISDNIAFDVVLDPFSDTYLPYLSQYEKLNPNSTYVTCGIFNQSREKRDKAPQIKLSELFGEFIAKNIKFVGNCLGPSESLDKGVELLSENKTSHIVIDSTFNEEDGISEFIERTFNIKNDRFGKVSFLY